MTDHEIGRGFRVHEVTDERLAAASPEYRAIVRTRNAEPVLGAWDYNDWDGSAELSEAGERRYAVVVRAHAGRIGEGRPCTPRQRRLSRAA